MRRSATNLVYEKAFTIGWDKHINPKVDFDLIKKSRSHLQIYLSLLYRTLLK